MNPMKNVAVFAAFAATVLTAVRASAQSQTWNIDPNHTASQFAVRHMLVSTVRGQFDKTTGTVTWDGKDPKSLQVTVEIDASSVNTRVAMRDNDLRSADFFDVAKFPTITFVSKKADVVDATHFKLTGALTMHGVTKDVVLDVEGPSAPITQGSNLRIGASASLKINRHDFDLHYNRVVEAAPVVGDEITITIDIEAVRRAG
jgi:polyisoprenoid-binding protein YceI